MEMTKTSGLIISFNCWKLLDACLQSILASPGELYEIIVIDNASVDETVVRLKEKYPQVRLVENTENVGHTRAVNQGCRLADGDRILLLDADTELKPDAIVQLSEFLDHHPDAWMAAPKLLNTDGSIQASARNFPAPINGIFGRQSLLTRLFPNNPISEKYLEIKKLSSKTPYIVEHVSAACMLFRKEMVETVGYWDENFHSYWVDADWCKRLQDAGGRVYFVPQAVVTHHDQNKRAVKKSPVRIVKFHQGALSFYCKHYTRSRMDPRRGIAAILLYLRMGILLLTNEMKRDAQGQTDPLGQAKKCN